MDVTFLVGCLFFFMSLLLTSSSFVVHLPNDVSRTILKGKRKTITLFDGQTQRQYNCHLITADRASHENYLGGQWFNFYR
ncbi:transmembrane protein, putative [Medicago truncatula]|uniref:Transmembrane protein, putative n=1 Tax=Medicago truncatula TaxID=3880 RepID=G7J4P0_MEDTR|nr:transmembrane protein, putative [Medicago truncatula]